MRPLLSTVILEAFLVGMPLALSAQTPSPARFATPEQAAQALIDATAKDDTAALATLFGPKGKAIMTTGNPQQDTAERAEFSKLAQAEHKIEPDPMNHNRATLTIGKENWPFPAPLIKSGGKWSFDAQQAQSEMRFRRVGRNELDVVEACEGYVSAQQRYAASDREKKGMQVYAQKLLSSASRHDGLYWTGDKPLVPAAFAQADTAAASSPKPYHGYYFRVLKGQAASATGGAHDYLVKGEMLGGFALVAWPAQYGVTGVHTFIVNQDGLIYEKDFGKQFTSQTPPVNRYDPDKSWKLVE